MLIYTVNSQIPHHFLELTVILVIDHAYCNPHSLLLVPYPVTNIFFNSIRLHFIFFKTLMTLNRHEVMVQLLLSIN